MLPADLRRPAPDSVGARRSSVRNHQASGGGCDVIPVSRACVFRSCGEELVARLPGATFTNPPSVNGAGTEVTYTAGTPAAEFWMVEHVLR